MSAKGRGALFSLLTQEKSMTEESNFSKDSNVDSGLCLNSIQTRGGELRRVGRGQLIKDLVSCSSLSTSLSSCSISKSEQKVGDHEIPALRNNNFGTPANIKKTDVQSMCSTEGGFIPYLPKNKQGNKGTPKNFACNYLRLNSNSEKGVYMYEVRFYPNVDSMNLRSKYLNEHRHNFGGVKTFDGTILFLPILLPEKLTTYKAKNVADGSDIEIRVMFKKKQTLKNCIHLYNILFDRVMKTLNYVRFDRKQYDPTDPKIIPQAKLEIWPGYVTAVDEYDGGLMLCCDVSHRLLCQKTVLEQLVEIHNASPSNFQDNAKKALLGSVVITRYNNQTYRIDAICFDKNPKSTFTTSSGEITFEEYYLKSHHITIADKKQPLLMSIKKQRCTDPQKNEEQIRCLIPELCFLTGLRDDIRSDYKLMREIASFTRVTPNQRIQALQKFYNNINNSTEAKKILSDWGLSLASSIEHVTGRTYDEESVFFKEKKFGIGVNADFGKYAVSNALIDVVALNKWVLVHCKSDTHAAKTFWEHLERNAKPLGVSILKPKIVVLDNDKIDTFVVALRENINPEVQMLVCICPNNRDDRYNAIKKICCAERPIASQVINAKTLSNPSRNRAIVQKIALQMNCKLGGSLWSVNIPFKNVMVCGIDSYHDASQKGNSVGAFVASLNATYTKWYSRAVMQTKGEEIVSGLCSSFIKALQAYKHSNRMLPDSVIIYRDGVGDGQLPLCAQHEIPQFENACKAAFDGYKIRITFIIVQKRINTRFYNVNGNSAYNPPPGSIIDHSITRANMFDFFLVSQSVRQGTVTPTHYIVLRDDASYEPDILQRLSYKLCFLYYNWPGTIRVPACCQYAHKMAYLIGQNIRRNASEDLSMKLFYL